MSENKNPYEKRPGDGKFKVDIDYDNSYFPSNRGVGGSSRSSGFSVNLPDDVRRPISPYSSEARRADSSFQRRTASSSPSSRNSSTARPGTTGSSTRPASNPRPGTTTRTGSTKGTAQQTRVASPTYGTSTSRKTVSSPKKKTRRGRKKIDLSKLSAAEIKYNKLEKRDRRIKSFLAFLVCIALITVLTTAISVIAVGAINDILAIDKSSGTTISVVVEEGDDFDKVFNKLCENGLISQKQISRFFCLYRKYDTVKYEAGAYYFDTSDGVEVMLEEMMVKTGNSNSVVRLTFPEGWSIQKIFEKIEKYEVCTAEKLYANLDIVAKQYSFYEKIKTTDNRTFMAEGYLFPDTYEFFKGESASSVLKKLFSNFEKKWKENYASRAKELGMSIDEILKIASIIQREAGNKSQMYDISSVIHNRLLLAGTFPNLQFDSTTDYVLSYKDSGVFSDYDYKLRYNAYNTYSVKGLPPGPICNPGMDAIDAALNPNSTSYYYFAHDSLGQIYLASTASEHEMNRAKINEVG